MYINQPNPADIEAAVSKLKKRDPKLAEIIDQIGPCHLERRTQGLTAVAYSVIGQQLSNSSARAIRSRFDILFGNDGVDPQGLAGTSEEELRKTGLSLAKAKCKSLLPGGMSNSVRNGIISVGLSILQEGKGGGSDKDYDKGRV